MISTFERSLRIEAPASAVRAWHFNEGAFERLTPPWEKVELVESPGALTNGSRAIIRVGSGPFHLLWVADHEITEEGFIDRQVKGPFAFWEHHHRFLPLDESTCLLVDSIQYRLPFGIIGQIAGGPLLRAKLDRLFRYRHQVTREALESPVEAPVN